jgi:hypothetical protein
MVGQEGENYQTKPRVAMQLAKTCEQLSNKKYYSRPVSCRIQDKIILGTGSKINSIFWGKGEGGRG